ncbi:MAG: hypothetical protein WKF51_07465 [Geodermatophilaceae bacterium]
MAGLAGIAAVGQLAGKTLFYLAGRGPLRLPRLFGTPPTEVPGAPRTAAQTRIAASVARWKLRIHRRRWLSAVFVATSASVGLPPFALVSVAARAQRISLPVFVLAGLSGRCARFAAVLALVQISSG